MKVRAARADDIPALARIAERSYKAAFASILENEVLRTRDAAAFADRFTTCWPHLTVAVSGEDLIGFCLMTDGHIDMLFLDPEATGRGAGALLLREAEAAGAKSLECFRDNHRARAFYERNGWTITREYDREFAGKIRSFVYFEKHGR